MKLSVKLLGAFAVLIALMAGLGVFSISRMSQINRASYDMSTHWMPSIQALGEIRFLCSKLRRTELVHILTTDEEQMRQLDAEMDGIQAQIDQKFKEYEPLISEPEERENYPKFRAAWDEYLAIHAKALVHSRKNENDEAAALALGGTRTLFNNALELLAVLKDVNARGGQRSADKAVAQYYDSRELVVGLIAFSCAAGVLLALYLTRNVLKQLGEDPGYLHFLANEIARGNVDAGFKPVRDERSVYGVIIMMIESLQAMITTLGQKSAELKTKNDELEQVFYVASHDLRSPLVNIDGYAKELGYSLAELRHALEEHCGGPQSLRAVDTIMNADIPESLRFIQTSAAKMDALLSGLLRLSRLGRAALKMEDLDMNALMSRIVDSTEFKVKEGGVALNIGVLPPCRGDLVQVGQVFSNLLDNALKYLSPDRPGVIRITGELKGRRCVYCVEDNGIGIDPAHQGVIFEIFHRLDPSRGAGEGLGLTIVKRSLARLGGEIWVSSEMGAGSRFYVSLPSGEDQPVSREQEPADA